MVFTQSILYFDAGRATSRFNHLVELLKCPLFPLQPLQVVHLHILRSLPSFEFLFLAHRIWLHLALLMCIGLKYGLLEKLVIIFLLPLVGGRS